MNQTCDVAVCIGRFQPVHAGHVAMLKAALAIAPRCIVVIGSAFQARTPKNPWTWAERAEMLRLAVSPQEYERIDVLPMRDGSDEALWAASVQHAVEQTAAAGSRIALVDARSAAAHEAFDGWDRVPIERSSTIRGSLLRDAFFAADDDALDATLAALVEQAPRNTLAFMRAWSALPYRRVLAEEWRILKRYHADWAQSPYPPIFVTVDAVVRCLDHVLLIRRGQAPGKGLLAVPGGFIDEHETTYRSAVRELREETGLDASAAELRASLKAVAVFDDPERSQRGRTITHAHYFDLDRPALPAVQAADDAQSADWVPLTRLGALEDQFHDDHFQLLRHFSGLWAHSATPRNGLLQYPDTGRGEYSPRSQALMNWRSAVSFLNL